MVIEFTMNRLKKNNEFKQEEWIRAQRCENILERFNTNLRD